MSSPLKIRKVVASLPPVIEPDTIYVVRTGAGFDLYVTNNTGQIAHRLNIPTSPVVQEVDSDPLAPGDGESWVLREVDVEEGELVSMFGGMPYTADAATHKYKLSIKTSEGVKRTALA